MGTRHGFLQWAEWYQAQRLAASARPTDVIPQADGDAGDGELGPADQDEQLRRDLRRALLEDFHV